MNRFRAIPGYDGYQVSDTGVVRSYRKPGGGRRARPIIIGGTLDDHGYPSSHLVDDAGREVTVRIHSLLALAFIGPRPEGQEVRHVNGDRTDCRLANLAYGTRSENCLDREQHNPRTHCVRNHPFDEANTYTAPNGDRGCRTCRRAAQAAYRARKAKGATA